MKTQSNRLTKFLVLTVLVSVVSACGLPRPGPNKSEILNIDLEDGSSTEVVVVSEQVNRLVAIPPEPGFPTSLINAGAAAPDRIRPGDTLSFTVFENVDDGVLNQGGSGSSDLGAIQVDEDGFIYFPYAGRIRAAGNTPEALRRIITDKLGAQTPEPQVLVQRASGDGATVSILGDGIASQGV